MGVFSYWAAYGFFGVDAPEIFDSPPGDFPMKIRMDTQIPDWVVYVALYGIIFGVSAFVMVRDPEGPTNWVLYAGVTWAVAAGAVKLGWSRLRRAEM
jgi:hypothetical protein